MSLADHDAERLELLHQMGSITRMRRGSVNAQSFTQRRRDGSVVTQGPYYLYSRTEQRRSYSQRIPADAVAQYRTETENCRRFKDWTQRFQYGELSSEHQYTWRVSLCRLLPSLDKPASALFG